MHFRRKNCKETDLKLSIGKNNIGYVNKYKYLGIMLGCHLEIDVITEFLAGSGSRALSQLIHKTHSNYDLGHKSFTSLYNACVVPILDYVCGAWHTGKVTKIDQIQQRAIRYYCGLPRTCPILALDNEIGWTPGVIHRDLETLRLYNQIVQMDAGRVTRIVFEYDKRIKGAWYCNLLNICETIGCTDMLNESLMINVDHAKEILTEQYTDVLLTKMSKTSKLLNYSQIASTSSAAKHVQANLKKEQKIINIPTKARHIGFAS